MPVLMPNGKHYFLVIVDDFTWFAFIYLLTCKKDTLDAFKVFIVAIPQEHQCHTIQSNQGGEFESNTFQQLLAVHRIKHNSAALYTPELNGITKQFNQLIVTIAHCLLLQSGVPQHYWGEALSTALYLYNRFPNKANNQVPPAKLWPEGKTSLKHIHTFGCHTYILNQHSTTNKLNSKSRPGIYLGPVRDKATHH
jgi:transposase InsO family protein